MSWRSQSYPIPGNGWSSWCRQDIDDIYFATGVTVKIKKKDRDARRKIWLTGPVDKFPVALDLTISRVLAYQASRDEQDIEEARDVGGASSSADGGPKVPRGSIAAEIGGPYVPNEPSHPPPASAYVTNALPASAGAASAAKAIPDFVLRNIALQQRMLNFMMVNMVSSMAHPPQDPNARLERSQSEPLLTTPKATPKAPGFHPRVPKTPQPPPGVVDELVAQQLQRSADD